MTLDFEPLSVTHFPLLLQWLERPHVKRWWDPEITWTQKKIQEKYSSYVHGYKIEDSVRKTITAYIITADQHPIGYIQSYNAHDFPRSISLEKLPTSLGTFDLYIGELDYLGKGLGSQALVQFLDTYCTPLYSHMFADPNQHNLAAIKTYTKAGFKRLSIAHPSTEVWMLR